MGRAGNDKRISGAALELIMQDVLDGMQNFTQDICSQCTHAHIDIVTVERSSNSCEAAVILPFGRSLAHRK